MSFLVNIGQWNNLKVARRSEYGVFLDGGEDGDILLPRRYEPENVQIGDALDVFIYFDSEDRMVATTEIPKALVGEFAALKVVSVANVGAFLDWGLPKDLFLPHAEQTDRLTMGQTVLVYLYVDKSDRISASMRLERNIDKTPGDYKEGQAVQVVVAGKTDLGTKAIIEGRHWGLFYENEVFKSLHVGQRLQAYIKAVRHDGKIDLSLTQPGHEAAQSDIGPQILDLLKKKGGFLAINDKTSAEEIHRLFGVSKKKYKIALGGLYKKRLITVHSDGIRLV